MDTRVAYPDERVNSVLTGIEKINLELIDGGQFVEQDVYFDGRRFKNCSFVKCHVFIKLGHFMIEGDKVEIRDCTFTVDGPAGRAREFEQFVLRMQGQK